MAAAPSQRDPGCPAIARPAETSPTFTPKATKLTARQDRPPFVLLELYSSTPVPLHLFQLLDLVPQNPLQLHHPLNPQSDTMATFFDGVKKSWEDVPVDASKD